MDADAVYNFSMGQHRNSRSKMCTTEMNLDVNRRIGLTVFAGLVTWYSLCMVPGRRYETGNSCSVACCLRMICEPNAMLHLPKLDSRGLAEERNEDDIPQLEFRTGWMKRTFGASWSRDFDESTYQEIRDVVATSSAFLTPVVCSDLPWQFCKTSGAKPDEPSA